MATQLG